MLTHEEVVQRLDGFIGGLDRGARDTVRAALVAWRDALLDAIEARIGRIEHVNELDDDVEYDDVLCSEAASLYAVFANASAAELTDELERIGE